MNDQKDWVLMAALSSAILAILAALTAVKATSYGNTVTRDLIRSANEWNHFQAKGIKANLLQTKIDLKTLLKQPVSPDEIEKLASYKSEQEELGEKAKHKEESIEYHLRLSGLFTRGMTFFQIAIGIIAVAILTKKRTFWYGGLVLGVCGLFFVGQTFFV